MRNEQRMLEYTVKLEKTMKISVPINAYGYDHLDTEKVLQHCLNAMYLNMTVGMDDLRIEGSPTEWVDGTDPESN